MALEAGLAAGFAYVVTDADTAIAAGSGDVPVLATPRVVALAERATCAAVDGHLPEGTTSVGSRVEIDHLRPTRVGETVRVDAVLEAVEGRTLRFAVRVGDAGRPVAVGTVRRVVVERARFLGAPGP